MTREEATKKYVDAFGGFPYELVCDCDDERIVELVTEALKTGEEIAFDDGNIY